MTEKRKHEGMFLKMSILENMTAAATECLSKNGIVQYGERKKNAMIYAGKMTVKISGLGQSINNLSGGNQQKVLMGMWLSN